jgi:hypothetical protein
MIRSQSIVNALTHLSDDDLDTIRTIESTPIAELAKVLEGTTLSAITVYDLQVMLADYHLRNL